MLHRKLLLKSPNLPYHFHKMLLYIVSVVSTSIHLLASLFHNLEVKREYYQNCSAPCWVVWHNVHSQQHTHVSSSYRSSRLGLSHWGPYAMHRGGCLELYCYIVVLVGFRPLSEGPTSFLQCFDTVGLVM